ncbi:MAG: NADH-quinone oxidoreductase subunit C [Acidobacteriota bacterium]
MSDETPKEPVSPPAGAGAAPKPATTPKPAAAAKPAAPPPPPEEPPDDLKTIRDNLRSKFKDAMIEEKVFRAELTARFERDKIVEVCRYLRDEHKFNFLSDLCGAHYPTREKPFEVVYHLYSIPNRNYIRLKIWLADGEHAPTVSGLWSTANWHEREAYDMFGITFDGHPDLRRILLPEDWKGFPLRKDYPLEGRGDYPIPARED